MNDLDDDFSLQPKLSSQLPITLISGEQECQCASVTVRGGITLSSCPVRESQEQEKKGINSKGNQSKNGNVGKYITLK